METIWAERALTAAGWRRGVALEIDGDGRIASLRADAPPPEDAERLGLALPAPVNLHSHAFQRAMAGLTERRGPGARDSFWTWRRLMYRFLERLDPDQVEAVAALAFMEMQEAGFGTVAEFHYLHHAPGGTPYADLAEMSARIAAAAAGTGIGLTLLPVLYQQGGCDGRALEGGQLRFGNDPERFARLAEAAGRTLADLPHARLGVAPHSLRAATPDGIAAAAALAPDGPVHIHAAEQRAEVEEVEAALGARPVEWLLANGADARWCLIHATRMTAEETRALAASGAVAGLCPVTEADLGDGVFDGVRYREAGGRFGVGTDSNVRISLAGELRMLDYSQRLRDGVRAALATPRASTGRALFEAAALGGAQAAGRDCGTLAEGRVADILGVAAGALANSPDLAGLDGDALLDVFVFAGGDRAPLEVWSGGRRAVRGGRHVGRESILRRYLAAVAPLRAEA